MTSPDSSTQIAALGSEPTYSAPRSGDHPREELLLRLISDCADDSLSSLAAPSSGRCRLVLRSALRSATSAGIRSGRSGEANQATDETGHRPPCTGCRPDRRLR